MNWKNLSFFGENKIINRSYIYLFIVPVIANLLSKIQSTILLEFGGEKIELVLHLPFSWKMFFFSALLFSIASLLYSFFGPIIIKENKSYGDFLSHKKNYTHLFHYLDEIGISELWFRKFNISMEEVRQKEPWQIIDKFGKSRFDWINKKRKDKLNLFRGVNRDMKNYNPETEFFQEQSFWTIYNYANYSRPFWLYLTTLLYVVGFTLISLVILQGVRLVLNI